MNRYGIGILLGVLAMGSQATAAEGDKLLYGFEDQDELRQWDFRTKSGQLSDQHVTQGKRSLKITSGDLMNLNRPGDWSGYESLDIDAFVEGETPVRVQVVVGDEAWQAKNGGSYWNRHNAGLTLRPGKNTISLPVTGMFRGEAGSRNNDIKSNIDPSKIVRFYVEFTGAKDQAVFLDNMRLAKGTRPANVWAFDLGPDSQTVSTGFTPIGPSTVYGKDGVKAGLRPAANPTWARDNTSPTRLYQDYIALDSSEFVMDLPNGQYKVWVVFDDMGYWGGETARFAKRTIYAEGKAADVEERGEAGKSDYLFRFESVEPKPGDSVWDLYMKHLVAPRRFEVQVSDGQLNLKFDGGGPLSTKVAALIVYPADSKEAAAWVAEVEQRNREEFESRAVFMGPNPKPLQVPEAAQAKGYWLGYPSMEQTVSFLDAPGKAEGKLHRLAAQNQRVSMTFAIRPIKDLSQANVELSATELKGEGGTIPAANVDLRYVHHGTRRGFNSIAYTIAPETLRPVKGTSLKLSKDLTRQFWVTVQVPADAKSGTYSGEVALKAGEVEVKLPISVEVLGMKLDEPKFAMGFYGTRVPGEWPVARGEGIRQLLALLKDNGMTSLSGGPNLSFKGLDASGKPMIDGYDKVDEYMRVARELGYNQEVNAYGGPGMVDGLHDGYVIGQAGRNWEQKTGKSFDELLKIVWTDVKEHAEKNNWLPIAYGMTDEPRVLEQVKAQLELMKAYRAAVPFVKIGGSYSVDWGKNDELHLGIQEIFKTLVWSAVNGHSDIDIQKAKEFGKELWIYNQGLSRFSFGPYQWAEMSKGVVGRVQWHTQALHGYQFYDLDGREPDTSVVMFGKEQIYPTLALPRCREGADDLRYAVTLWNLAEKNQDKPEAQAAQAWLKQVADSIPAGGRTAVPESLKEDEAFRNLCVEHLRKLMK